MKSNLRFRSILSIGIALILLLPLLAGCAQPAAQSVEATEPPAGEVQPPVQEAEQPSGEQLSFSIATGGTGGVWYPLGGAIGGLVGQYVPNTDATAEATTAAIDNLKLLTTDQVQMAFAYDYHVIWANEGNMPDVSPDAEPVRMVLGFYEQPLHIVTTQATGITSVEDLVGKRVSTGAPASGTEEQAIYVLSALGIDPEADINQEKLGASESVAALRDGNIDAFFWSGAIPTSSIIDLSSTPGMTMVLLPLSGETAQTIMDAYPGVFHPSTFPSGTYTGVNEDVDALAITAVLNAMESFPEDRVYQILDTIFSHKDELAAVWGGAANMSPETAVGQVSPGALDYLHPGAVRYFTEQGVLP